MSMVTNDGGPALPSAIGNGLSLRDYFASHAPVEVAGWFCEQELDEPIRPHAYWVHDTPETSRDLHQVQDRWRKEPTWDIEEKYPALKSWAKEWRKYWAECDHHPTAQARNRQIQWPYAWADAMLAEREKQK